MTERELKSIKLINFEIERIENVLRELGNSNKHSQQKENYTKLLKSNKEKLINKKIEAEKFIASIDDAEIRLILTLKFVDLKSWNYISKKLHYDRSTVYKKFKNFIRSKSNKLS